MKKAVTVSVIEIAAGIRATVATIATAKDSAESTVTVTITGNNRSFDGHKR